MQIAAAGIPVVAVGRNQSQLDAMVRSNAAIAALTADLAEPDAPDRLAAAIAERYPDTGCVINNAGVQDDVRLDDAGYTTARMQHELAVNLLAPMALTRALLPLLQRQPRAWVVNVTSGLAFAPKRTAAVYSASKAGLHLFTEALRVQMAGSSVNVVEAVMPLVDTPMTRGRGTAKMAPGEAAHVLIAALAAGRSQVYIGKARAVPFLRRWAPAALAYVIQRQ